MLPDAISNEGNLSNEEEKPNTITIPLSIPSQYLFRWGGVELNEMISPIIPPHPSEISLLMRSRQSMT